MANEIRLRSNNQQGTITDNPLTIGAVTINSAAFASLPTVTGVNHLVIILDPLELTGAAEIVIVTAHGAASTQVTVIRGQENTTARAHAPGTTWFHGPVESDFNLTQRTATSANRPTSPFSGEVIYETDTGRWASRNTAGVWLPSPHNPPSCRAFHNTTNAMASGTEITLAFNSESFDTDSMHSTAINTERITINTPGVYAFSWGTQLSSDNDYLVVYTYLRLNAATLITHGSSVGTYTDAVGPLMNGSSIYKAVAGDFFDIRAMQRNTSAGGSTSQANTTFFAATWIGVG